MKCSKCGREFGNGANCQNCGVDRVTGLGNYSGYYNPVGGDASSSSHNGEYTSSNTMICYKCSEIIPKDSEYCPLCGCNLYVTCPKCGHEYSSQYPRCNKCGTNPKEYYESQRREEEEKQRKQREWEQSPEGKAKFAQECKRKENKESLGIIIFWGGGTALTILLDVWMDENWLNIEFLSINIRILIMMCIGYGGAFLCAALLDEVMED